MNMNTYTEKPYSLNELYEELFDEDYKKSEDTPSFDTFKTYRFIWVYHESSSYFGEITVIYAHNNKYYLVKSDHCSCNWFYWDPEEVSKEFLLRQYPDINLDTDLFKS